MATIQGLDRYAHDAMFEAVARGPISEKSRHGRKTEVPSFEMF